MTSSDFLTDRADLLHTHWARVPKADRPPGGIAVALERFALTSNNLTYAKFGEELGYWNYFPGPPGWGRVPVWGIGRVMESDGDGPAEGERIYGFFPISESLTMLPWSLAERDFVDGAPHRAELSSTYNEYVRIDRDPAYDESCADAYLALRPLFSLGFFLAAWLDEQAFFGARRVIVSSASSKTAAALADQLRGRVERIGLTSSVRRKLVEQGDRFERVIAYGELDDESHLTESPAIFIDIAGDPEIRGAVHRRLGSMLVRSIRVGATRGGPEARELGAADDLPGPKPEFFFTPMHILRLHERWGRAVLRDRLSASLSAFLRGSASWLRYEILAGKAEIANAYGALARGAAPADSAAILTAPGRD